MARLKTLEKIGRAMKNEKSRGAENIGHMTRTQTNKTQLRKLKR